MDHGERFNGISHGVETLLAAIGGALLVAVSAIGGDPRTIVACGVYAATLLILYITSTLYHSLSGSAKNILRKMDHCAIYLLIAGTYTPFTLVTLRGTLGWTLFGVVWAWPSSGSPRNSASRAGRVPLRSSSIW